MQVFQHNFQKKNFLKSLNEDWFKDFHIFQFFALDVIFEEFGSIPSNVIKPLFYHRIQYPNTFSKTSYASEQTYVFNS